MARDQLALVERLAERREKEAGSRLSVARDAVDQSQGQLSQVLDYRKDYYRLATGATGKHIDTNSLRTARHFLSELDDIIARQQQSLRQAELALEQQTVQLVFARRRQQPPVLINHAHIVGCHCRDRAGYQVHDRLDLRPAQ